WEAAIRPRGCRWRRERGPSSRSPSRPVSSWPGSTAAERCASYRRRQRRSTPVASFSSWARLHPGFEREHTPDERLRHLEDPVLAHGGLTLIPGRERQPFTAVEPVKQMAQVQHAGLDVAVERARQWVTDEHVLDEVTRDRKRLQDAA